MSESAEPVGDETAPTDDTTTSEPQAEDAAEAPADAAPAPEPPPEPTAASGSTPMPALTYTPLGAATPGPAAPPAPAAIVATTTDADQKVTIPGPVPMAARRYTTRFAIIYGILAVSLIGAVTAAVLQYVRNGGNGISGNHWSTWAPPSGTSAAKATAIANHVATLYAADDKGAQLDSIDAHVPEIYLLNSNTKDKFLITRLAVRRKVDSNVGVKIFDADTSWSDQLCGFGDSCTLTGTPSAGRAGLLRRQALELALYTFKFTDITSLLVFLPPVSVELQPQLMFLQKDNLEKQLSEPLSKTLPLTNPPPATKPDTVEQKTVDALTLPALYGVQGSLLQNQSLLLMLNPAQ